MIENLSRHALWKATVMFAAIFIQTARPNKATALGLEEAGERLSCDSTPVFIHRHPAEFLSELCSNVAI